MRAEGVGNIREWLNMRYAGTKSNANMEWVDLWNAASELDFMLTGDPATDLQVLATSDGAEIRLRRLAAYAHYLRTGDLTSATHFLAIEPPGTNTDVAPAWMVSEANNYSKIEHQRAERVNPKGKGRKGDGKNAEKGEK